MVPLLEIASLKTMKQISCANHEQFASHQPFSKTWNPSRHLQSPRKSTNPLTWNSWNVTVRTRLNRRVTSALSLSFHHKLEHISSGNNLDLPTSHDHIGIRWGHRRSQGSTFINGIKSLYLRISHKIIEFSRQSESCKLPPIAHLLARATALPYLLESVLVVKVVKLEALGWHESDKVLR